MPPPPQSAPKHILIITVRLPVIALMSKSNVLYRNVHLNTSQISPVYPRMSLFEGLVTLYLAKKKGKQQQQKHKAFVRVLFLVFLVFLQVQHQ